MPPEKRTGGMRKTIKEKKKKEKRGTNERGKGPSKD
jgi:hypothetical protein